MKNYLLCNVGTSLLSSFKRLAQASAAQAQGLSEHALDAQNAVAAAKYLQRPEPAHRGCGAEINSITLPERYRYLRDKPALRCLDSIRTRSSSWAKCCSTTTAGHLPR